MKSIQWMEFSRDARDFQEFRRRYHTSSVELAKIANAVKPGLLVLYHRGNRARGPVTQEMDDVLLAEIRQTYKGDVVAARDLECSEMLAHRCQPVAIQDGFGSNTSVGRCPRHVRFAPQ